MALNNIQRLLRQNVENELCELAEENRDKLETALIKKIDGTHICYNSVNVALGKQRTGKTRGLTFEIILISMMCPNTHLLVYSNKTGSPTDLTFETFKEKIDIPIVYISHDSLKEFLENMLEYKQLYNEIYKDGLGDKIIKKKKNELFKILHISDFDRPFLHTLVFLEDIANAKILQKGYILELMTQCAHINCSFFLATQFWRNSIPTTIKTQVTTIFIFAGYSLQQFRYIMSQLPIEFDVGDLWNTYRSMHENGKMIVNTRTGELLFD
jgi:hypothetical protein